jgi:2-methylcitrate dehydratase
MTGKSTTFRTCARMMAEFAFGLSYDSIPKEVMAAARRHLADSMACALGAYNTAAVQAVRQYATEKGGRADATILGTKQKVPAGSAALVNGTMVRYLDANDIFLSSRGGPSGHCSDATPGLLACAEKHRRSGKELLVCLAASYELQGALAQSFNFWDRGLHMLTNTGWLTAIAAARLAGGTPQQAVHACGLSVATNTALNTWLRPTSTIPMIKGVAVGLILERALEAVELATLGVTANEDALETAFSSMNPGPNTNVDARPLEQLGKRWTSTRNMIKAYPAQLYTQPAIEASLCLYHQGVRAGAVRRLTLYGHRHVCGGVQGSPQAFAPQSREAADHSTPYVMAMALLRGHVTAREYHDAPWKSSEVRSAMAKITLITDPGRDRALDTDGMLGVRLVAELMEGDHKEIIVEQPKGHPDAPLSDAELLNKMASLLEGIAPEHTPRRLLELCNRLSTVDDVCELVAACNVA